MVGKCEISVGEYTSHRAYLCQVTASVLSWSSGPKPRRWRMRATTRCLAEMLFGKDAAACCGCALVNVVANPHSRRLPNYLEKAWGIALKQARSPCDKNCNKFGKVERHWPGLRLPFARIASHATNGSGYLVRARHSTCSTCAWCLNCCVSINSMQR